MALSASTISCEATLCHGIASGIYYGTLFGMTSRFVFGKEPHNIKRLSGKILMKQIAFGAMGLATFSTIFNGVNCATSLLFPDDRLKPINKGFSGFVATFFFALYEFRSIKPAMRSSLAVGGLVALAHSYDRNYSHEE